MMSHHIAAYGDVISSQEKFMKKKIKILVTFLLLLGLGWGGYYVVTNNMMNNQEELSSLPNTTYVCPMHPHIVKDHEGTCPICGMDLVKKEPVAVPESKQETVIEHAMKHADPTYVCPMHPQIVKGKEGSCPICGMDLVKKETTANKSSGEKKLLYWVAPMDANYRRDKPGKSLMGMDLVPVYDEGMSATEEDGLPIITIKANTAQNMGVRVATVKRRSFNRTIRTVGSITYNEDSLLHVHPRASGWVEKVHIKAVGDQVEKGSVLLDLYSPDIVAAQKDLIIAKKSGKLLMQKGVGSLVEAAKQRLRLLGVSDNIIEQVQRSGQSKNYVPMSTSRSGVVISMGIREGMYVTPSTEMYAVADLSTVWVLVDVFEHQYEWFSVGNKAEITVSGIPGKIWKGEVEYIYPELNEKTRTLKVRLKFANKEQRLKPNMFADVTIHSAPKKALTIPLEAIIYDEIGARIVKVIGEHRYQPIPITIGMKSRGQAEVLQGLKVGDKVVVSGQFMLDSESNLQASFRRLSE